MTMGKVVGRIQKRICFFSYREWGTGYVGRMGMTANFCEKRETTFEPLPATERRFGGVSATPMFFSGHVCVDMCIIAYNKPLLFRIQLVSSRRFAQALFILGLPFTYSLLFSLLIIQTMFILFGY